MEKNQYFAPEMKLINLQAMSTFLSASFNLDDDSVIGGGTGNPSLPLD